MNNIRTSEIVGKNLNLLILYNILYFRLTWTVKKMHNFVDASKKVILKLKYSY